MNRILRADLADAVAILELQKRAYQQEAALYDDWTIPPLTQTPDQINAEFDNMTAADPLLPGDCRCLS